MAEESKSVRWFESPLAVKTMSKMGIRIAVVVTLAALVSYYHIASALNAQVQDSLKKYISERGQRESQIFVNAERNHQAFKAAFLSAWGKQRANTDFKRFERWFIPAEDGTIRLHEHAFTGSQRADGTLSAHITGYIGRQAPDSAEFKNRLLLSYELIDRYADGWTQDYANLYVAMPENVNLVYWPGVAWGLQAVPSLDINAEEWFYVANQANNPERRPAWTGLYYDQTADEWMVSLETPVDSANQHLINIGHDILLNTLIERVFNDKLEGAYNFIFRPDGRIIAHPHLVDELRAKQGLLDISGVNDTDLKHVIQLITEQSEHIDISGKIFDDDQTEALLAVTRIEGPDWLFVTVYPKSLMSLIALETAKIVILVGLASLIIELLILAFVLRDQVLQPLQVFVRFSRDFATQGSQAVSTLSDDKVYQRNDETGSLAQSMVGMATTIINHEESLEEQVQQRTEKMNELNLALAEESKSRQDLLLLLQTIARDVSGLQGENYFNTLNEFLATMLDSDFVLIGRVSEDHQYIDSLSASREKKLIDNISYPVKGTPCEVVLEKGPQVFNGGIQPLFPHDQDLVDLNIESYIGTPLLDLNGNAIGHIAVMNHAKFDDPEKAQIIIDSVSTRAASELVRQVNEEVILHQAQTDALTGLPNRTVFMDRISQSALRAKRQRSKFAVLFVDMDNFKLTNDQLGHAAGDEVLKQTASRLSQHTRQQDTVARLGGDEFIILLDDVRDMIGIENVADNILQSMAKPIPVLDTSITVSCSLGIAIYPDDGESIDMLISNADSAMYRAKELGRNHFQFYCPSMNTELDKHRQIEHDLRQAISSNQLELYYQPILSLSDGEICRAEGLVRWLHPESGLVSPDTFIAVAESTGQIIAIGKLVLQQACQDFNQLKTCWPNLETIAINCSARQFRDPKLAENFTAIVESFGLSTHCIELEVTESLFIDRNDNSVIETLHRLREAGFCITLDDFGTGYSSLSYLKNLPLDGLKIDRSFISDLGVDASNLTLVKSIIELAHNFELSIVAEGVEKQEQETILKRYHCDYVQGYYYSHPLPLAEIS